jgi:hypothetical protein
VNFSAQDAKQAALQHAEEQNVELSPELLKFLQKQGPLIRQETDESVIARQNYQPRAASESASRPLPQSRERVVFSSQEVTRVVSVIHIFCCILHVSKLNLFRNMHVLNCTHMPHVVNHARHHHYDMRSLPVMLSAAAAVPMTYTPLSYPVLA